MTLALLVGAGIWLLAPATTVAQGNADNTLRRLEAAFAGADARELVEHSSDHLQVALMGKSTLYSKSQAMYVLQDFFRQYPPGKASLSSPETSGESLFVSGSYLCRRTARSMQLYLHLVRKEGQWEMREIRIDQRSRE